jgi:hypothetical protein
MEFPISSTTLLVVLSLIIGFITFFMPAEFYKWLSRKRYQYEVTTSLYMLTPTEKFIFSTSISSASASASPSPPPLPPMPVARRTLRLPFLQYRC